MGDKPVLQRIFNLAGLLIIILVWSCANPLAPTGGPKDVTPPEVVLSHPENRSVDFNKSQIQLEFNEYVQLKNTSGQVIISPPFTNAPEFRLRGKSVTIQFEEALKDNTTYTLFFGEAITDITENNPLINYWFVFSTGDILDSLSLNGKVLNAFTLKPEEKVSVMLYDTPGDSVPYKERPYYVSRTDKEGVFHFYNLRDQKYQVFALKETNGNYLYDAGNEMIAFSDTLVQPYYVPPAVGVDLTDSVIMKPVTRPDLSLFLFQEMDSTQRLMENKLLSKGVLRLVFRIPLKAPEIKLLDTILPHPWYKPEWNVAGDTLLMWLYKDIPDTLFVELTDHSVIVDTIRLLTQPIVKEVKGKKEPAKDQLQLSSNIRAGKLDPFSPLNFSFSSPVVKYDVSGLVLIIAEDTLMPPAFFVDSLQRKLTIPYLWTEATSYTLIIPDSVFVGLDGNTQDTLRFTFTTKARDEYGALVMNLQIPDPSEHYLIQLMKEGESIVDQRIITGQASEKIEFLNLNPGKFRLKAIFDRNKNNQWDTGIYSKRIAPEKVLYFDKTLELRANWISEESWEL